MCASFNVVVRTEKNSVPLLGIYYIIFIYVIVHHAVVTWGRNDDERERLLTGTCSIFVVIPTTTAMNRF